tara:strand:- start:549 stop:887 length:339 start_codon:yes stop_codon:yes gene_type:complete
MIESLSSTQSFNKVNPFSKVDTANGMPIHNYRVVDPISNSLRSKEFISKENIKNLYTRSLSYSNGDTTEKFLKSKNLMTPVFVYNEAKTKYDMISKMQMSLTKIKLHVNLLA